MRHITLLLALLVAVPVFAETPALASLVTSRVNAFTRVLQHSGSIKHKIAAAERLVESSAFLPGETFTVRVGEREVDRETAMVVLRQRGVMLTADEKRILEDKRRRGVKESADIADVRVSAAKRIPASSICVRGVDGPGSFDVTIIRAECLVLVASESGFRAVPIADYDFEAHFAAGDDAAVIYRIETVPR